MNGELLQNIRIQTPDIFCQLHHLFLPVPSLKGICIPDAVSIECLPKLFQQSTKIYIKALFRIRFTCLAIRHMICRAIMFY